MYFVSARISFIRSSITSHRPDRAGAVDGRRHLLPPHHTPPQHRLEKSTVSQPIGPRGQVGRDESEKASSTTIRPWHQDKETREHRGVRENEGECFDLRYPPSRPVVVAKLARPERRAWDVPAHRNHHHIVAGIAVTNCSQEFASCPMHCPTCPPPLSTPSSPPRIAHTPPSGFAPSQERGCLANMQCASAHLSFLLRFPDQRRDHTCRAR